jgi:SAM-dependent MidA family methyltransferase
MALEGVLIANELLDNLPVHVVERSRRGWDEVRVGVDDDHRFVELVVPAPADLAGEADHVAAGLDVPEGRRLPVPIAVREWLERAAMLLSRGEALLIDYADDARGFVTRGQSEWLRTYAGHRRGATPLEAPGHQDITCDLPLEHLRWAAERAGFVVERELSQADWLRDLGIAELVAEGEETWRARAHIGDIAAIAGRSRAVEAAALTDPAGLGAHRVVALEATSGPKGGGR